MADGFTFSTNTGGLITINHVDSGPFMHRAPKPKGIRAVKFTESNRDSLAAYFRETYKADDSGIKDVVVSNDTITLERDLSNPVYLVTGWTFKVGDWIVETYDYGYGITLFRRATLAEREKHDLR